jgi:uncharacterized protein
MPPLNLADVDSFLIAAAVALVAGVIRGFTGFGGGATMVLVLTQFFDPTSVIARMVLVDLVANVRLLPTTWREIDWRAGGTMTLVSCLAIPLGIGLLLIADPMIMKKSIAVVVAISALALLTGYRFKAAPTMPALIVVGVIAGVIMGATYIAVMFMIFIYSLPGPAAVTRANGILWGFATTVAMIPLFVISGDLGWDDVWRAGLIGLLYLGSVWFGAHYFRRTQEALFRRIVLIFLLVLSVIGIVT